jgi:predicted hotdog family 3-hydroxylacyl-ACP dehydratase
VTEKPRAGYLASVSDVVCAVRRLDDLDGDLVIEAEKLAGDDARVQYRFTITSNHTQILTGKAAVVLAA